MARAGEVIRNPATGETVTFLITASDSDGELLQLEMAAEKSSTPTHMHPKIAERWDLREGRVHFWVGKNEHVLNAPAQLEIPAGTPHRFWNDGPIRTVVDHRPAGRFEDFLVTVYALAAAGKTNKGMPNILRAAVIAREHLDDYALPFPPPGVQRVLFEILAPLGRAIGYSARYP
jgi:mannose-6-phosphate isomerase-like protein (cupin superfamily)